MPLKNTSNLEPEYHQRMGKGKGKSVAGDAAVDWRESNTNKGAAALSPMSADDVVVVCSVRYRCSAVAIQPCRGTKDS